MLYCMSEYNLIPLAQYRTRTRRRVDIQILVRARVIKFIPAKILKDYVPYFTTTRGRPRGKLQGRTHHFVTATRLSAICNSTLPYKHFAVIVILIFSVHIWSR